MSDEGFIYLGTVMVMVMAAVCFRPFVPSLVREEYQYFLHRLILIRSFVLACPTTCTPISNSELAGSW